MRIPSNQRGRMCFTLLIAAGLLAPLASAQQQQEEAEAQEWDGEILEIVVTSPGVEVQETRSPGRGSRVSMSYAVRFADLDLRTRSGRAELEERVREAANEICLLLSERYAGSRAGATRCTRQSIDDAMPQVQAAIEAAETR